MSAVSRLTGLSEHLLRAWERRHGVIVPARTEGGTRRYSDEDVERLRLVKAAVDSGRPIGQVARLSNRALARLVTSEQREQPAIGALLDYVRDADADGLSGELRRLARLLGARRLAFEVIGPLQVAVGDGWHRGEVSVAQEHLATAACRSVLDEEIRRHDPLDGAARFVFTTPPGDRHEVGILVAALLAAGRGVRPIYLGPCTPPGPAAELERRCDASAVVIGLTDLPSRDAGSYLKALRAGMRRSTRLLVGGAAARGLSPLPRVRILADLQDYERALPTPPEGMA